MRPTARHAMSVETINCGKTVRKELHLKRFANVHGIEWCDSIGRLCQFWP